VASAPPPIAAGVADALATLHRTLPVNAPLAIRQLVEIRADLGLSTIGVLEAAGGPR
jgi:hypothetical protein